MAFQPLPIDSLLPDVVARLREHNCFVLCAPTGAGKTTRVPPAVLAGGIAGTERVLVLEPRRLAARAAARRMADEAGAVLGDDIGYHVRFDKRCRSATRIIACTPGILLRQIQDDPFLEGVGAVLFDEFHERTLEIDLALGLVRLTQQTVRPDLRIVVMSATLDIEAVNAYLGGSPSLASAGRLHPVQIHYEPRPTTQSWPMAAARAAERLLELTSGDLLVFLPGLHEIRQTARHLEDTAQRLDLAVAPLYGDLPADQQDAALLPQKRRKVVLATNVAETSVTVEGISGVVDTGLARQLQCDSGVGLDRLRLTSISKDSADQRAGRAGRTQPGVCLRLWSEVSHRSRAAQTEPEILRVDLAGAYLQLRAYGETKPERFPWLTPPRPRQVGLAETLLRRLGAVAETGVTDVGRRMARLPLQPRLGRLLIEGQRLGNPGDCVLAAALLSERDPFRRDDQLEFQRPARRATTSDVLDRVEALKEFERTGRHDGELGPLNRYAARFVLRARDQLLRGLREESGPDSDRAPAADASLPRALLAAFPDRVVRRRTPGSPRGVMVGGRGVRLAASSGVLDAELFLAIDVDAGQKEALVRQASMIERDWLPVHLLRDSIEVSFDADAEKVIARRRVRFEDLLIEESSAAMPDEEEAARLLAESACNRFPDVVPATDTPAGKFRTRVQWLREVMPELGLPALEAGDLAALLPQVCRGCRSFADLRRADWLSFLEAALTFRQRQALEREAPERLLVPSGSKLAIQYEVGKPPVLAVRIQEVFGLSDTPRLAGGRMKVLLHLLAPNSRPQQITDDLVSFWSSTYTQVRKDLRTRYPRHAWPEDPANAVPERRPKRKK